MLDTKGTADQSQTPVLVWNDLLNDICEEIAKTIVPVHYGHQQIVQACMHRILKPMYDKRVWELVKKDREHTRKECREHTQ